jgi:hypothetical protein
VIFQALRKGFPDRDFVIDDDVLVAAANIALLNKASAPEDVILVSDKTSFPVKDHTAIQRIESRLNSSGIHIIHDVAKAGTAELSKLKAANVIVLTGHKDAAFIAYLRQLVDSGILRGKTVLMASCYSRLDAAWASSLIQDSGAREVIYFSDEINSLAVEKILIKLGGFLKERSLSGGIFRLIEAAAAKGASGLGNQLRSYVDHMSAVMIHQVSILESPHEQSNG